MGLSSVPTSCILGSAVVIGAAKALGSPAGAAFAPALPCLPSEPQSDSRLALSPADNPCIPRAGARARAYRGALLATPRKHATQPASAGPAAAQLPPRTGWTPVGRPEWIDRETTKATKSTKSQPPFFECVLEGKGFFLRNQVAVQRKRRAGLRAVGWGRWLSNLLLALPAAPSAAPRCP